jgi:hypothetical protein
MICYPDRTFSQRQARTSPWSSQPHQIDPRSLWLILTSSHRLFSETDRGISISYDSLLCRSVPGSHTTIVDRYVISIIG